jgi:hypothetical protein
VQLRWVYFGALTIGICAPSSVAAPRSHQVITLLARFAPKIERASTRAPEAGDAIARLLIFARHRIANGPNDQATKVPRKAARERVANPA